MRVNEYEALDDFIYEYEQGKEFSWQNDEHRERFMGIEFSYKNRFYRMCREPYDEMNTPVLEDGNPALYDVMIIHCEKRGYPRVDRYEVIGWYRNLQDVLDNCIIDARPFKEIIMDDQTAILGKD